MGYALWLVWVIYNQRLTFHYGDTIIEAPSFPLLQMTPRSIDVPNIIFGDATQRQIITTTATLKIRFRLSN
jgi:hypothetical protein